MIKWIYKMIKGNRVKEFLCEEDGFSLIELMVVIVIMGLLTTVVIINVMPSQDRAMVEKTRADIRSIEQAVEMYRLDVLRYPTMEKGLEALVKSKEAGQPKGGYIKSLPKDPWGSDYQYLIPGNHSIFDVFSFGADGRLGGEDLDRDIGNWTEE